MVTRSNDAGCPEDRVIRVRDASFLKLMRKSPNETPDQFNQRRGLVLDFVLRTSKLVHLVTKQAYEKINLVTRRAYEENVSLKDLGFNIFGKGSRQCYENICHLE